MAFGKFSDVTLDPQTKYFFYMDSIVPLGTAIELETSDVYSGGEAYGAGGAGTFATGAADTLFLLTGNEVSSAPELLWRSSRARLRWLFSGGAESSVGSNKERDRRAAFVLTGHWLLFPSFRRRIGKRSRSGSLPTALLNRWRCVGRIVLGAPKARRAFPAARVRVRLCESRRFHRLPAQS
jgi:hypothetical protein